MGAAATSPTPAAYDERDGAVRPTSMIVLALNCGSSSIKFAAYDGAGTHRVARGAVERLGERANVRFQGEGTATLDETTSVPGHAEGVRRIVEWMEARGRRLDAVGHRVVHGGARFVASVRLDASVVDPTQGGEGRLVALHLGHGCRAAAIAHGRSVDTSMGLTPLEGLVMGTRAGDLDPAIVDFLARREAVAAAEVTRWLNTRSGLRGVSGTSSD